MTLGPNLPSWWVLHQPPIKEEHLNYPDFFNFLSALVHSKCILHHEPYICSFGSELAPQHWTIMTPTVLCLQCCLFCCWWWGDTGGNNRRVWRWRGRSWSCLRRYRRRCCVMENPGVEGPTWASASPSPCAPIPGGGSGGYGGRTLPPAYGCPSDTPTSLGQRTRSSDSSFWTDWRKLTMTHTCLRLTAWEPTLSRGQGPPQVLWAPWSRLPVALSSALNNQSATPDHTWCDLPRGMEEGRKKPGSERHFISFTLLLCFVCQNNNILPWIFTYNDRGENQMHAFAKNNGTLTVHVNQQL